MKGIYKFTNNINGKCYIGQSIHIEERYNQHRRNYLNKNSSQYNDKVYRAFRKYGFENFNFEILEQSEEFSDDDLNNLEIYYINKFDSFCNGYNANLGGSGSRFLRKLTIDIILKIKEDLLNSSLDNRALSKKYDISEGLISMINNGKIHFEIGNFEYPIRENIGHTGERNSKARLTNEEVLNFRKQYVEKELDDIYKENKGILCYSSFKKMIYGITWKNIPVYKKRIKKWYLNGTCIDYPRLEE